MGAASVIITDDPPRITISVARTPSNSEIGSVTVTRAGGDFRQPLTVWLETTGAFTENGETMTVKFAAMAVIPAGATTLTLLTLADTSGALVNFQTPGAELKGARTDQSAQLTALYDALDTTPGAAQNFIDAVTKLPTPSTYQEYSFLKGSARGYRADDADLFSTGAMYNQAVAAARSKIGTIDWRTVPIPVQAVVSGLGTYGMVLAGAGWPQYEVKLNAALADLGSKDFQTRENAESDLKAMFTKALSQGDLARAMMVLDRFNLALRTTPDAEVRNRAQRLVTFANSSSAVQIYDAFKLQAAAAVTGGRSSAPRDSTL